MENPSHAARVLLLHDGELAEVRGLLDALELDRTERLGGAARGDLRGAWHLVIGTPQRLLEFEEGLPWGQALRVAVLDADARTLRAALRRADIEYVVRRPFHPEALRLLLLHLLYHGPERRRQRRVGIGATIHFRAGWRRRSGVLIDLSLTGCRLLTDEAIPPGRQLSLQLPPEIAGGRSLRLLGTVVRWGWADEGEDRMVALAFGGLPTRTLRRLEGVIGLHREGPAVFSGAEETQAATGEVPPERRRQPRHGLGRRIIALGADAAPVLLGRDISLAGMRVAANPQIRLGDVLQLALHVQSGDEPLVVSGRITRDDGASGLLIEFQGLSDLAREVLAKKVESLPILELDEGGSHAEVIVSRVLEQERLDSGEAAP